MAINGDRTTNVALSVMGTVIVVMVIGFITHIQTAAHPGANEALTTIKTEVSLLRTDVRVLQKLMIETKATVEMSKRLDLHREATEIPIQ